MRVEPTDVSRQLESLDASPAPGVARFDAGKPLHGRVAVLPSAFNPPTLAHLHLLEVAGKLGDVDSCAALLSTRNVTKGVFGATLTDRVGMLLASLDTAPEMAVLAVNAAVLADQADALDRTFPGASFDFVVGYDTLIRLFDPVYYVDMPTQLAGFFEHHRVIAANRGEAAIAQVREFVDTSTAPYASRIVTLEIAEVPASLSSTAARNAIASGDLPPVPPGVHRYIRDHHLYR